MLVVAFVVIIVQQLTRTPHLVAAVATGSVAYLLTDFPLKKPGLMAAVAVPADMGLLLSRQRAQESSLGKPIVDCCWGLSGNGTYLDHMTRKLSA